MAGRRRTPFQPMLQEQCQKGVGANKLAGFVGKWGEAKFTSIRNSSDKGDQPSRPKKFFKSRAVEPVLKEDANEQLSNTGKEPLSEITQNVPVKMSRQSSDDVVPRPAKKKKIFTRRKKIESERDKIPPLTLRTRTSQLKSQALEKKMSSEKAKCRLAHSDSSESQRSGLSSESQNNDDDDAHDIIIGHSEEQKLEQQHLLSTDKEGINNGTELYFKQDGIETRTDKLPEKKSSFGIEGKVISQDKGNILPAARTVKISRLIDDPQMGRLKQKSNKDVFNMDWDDEENPEADFKDENSVLNPKEAKCTKNLKHLVLQKAVTLSSADNLEKELQLSKNCASQPLSQESNSSQPASFAKKKSIFKSKNAISNNKKALSLYKHKFHNEKDEFKEVLNRRVFGSSTSSGPGFDFDDDFGAAVTTDMSFATTKLSRVPTLPANPKLNETNVEVVSVKCPKQQKGYYTVIKNVKKAHQIQDSGEFQGFNDDVEYILEGLGAKYSLSTRCLSTVNLASKCMEADFRMHLRAHGTATKFFSELRDSPQNASLALCASTVLFVLSQDCLNMDLDRDSLELMLNLLDTDSRIKDALAGSGMNKKELEKNKQKVQDLVATMKKKGHAVNLSLDQISADNLSMETLLSLTSKRAGEWFKEELRELGGLDHLVRTMSDCVNFLTSEEIDMWTENLLSKLKKAGRVLKVSENITHENEKNCLYLLRYENGKFLNLIHKLFKVLDEEVPLNPSFDLSDKESPAFILRESLFDCMRVYINLVHDYHNFSFGSELASRNPYLMDTILHTFFILPESIPEEKRFDVQVLALTLLINLVENCLQNRDLLMMSRMPESTGNILQYMEREEATKGFIKMFVEKEESARNEESNTNNILDGVQDEEEKMEQKDENNSKEERIEETVTKLLHKAGRHMEDTLIGSYITLVIGYLILDNKEYERAIREFLPQQNYSLMIKVLTKFFNFMNLTTPCASVKNHRGIRATAMIIKHLERIDEIEKLEGMERPQEVQAEENFDDLTIFDMTQESDVSNTLIDDP